MDPNYIAFAQAYSARTNVVYVGANDGMLHGFDAGQGTPAKPGTGNELMAYVPRGLLGGLHTNTFANAHYAHRYWVDGSPFSGDAQTAAPNAANAANPGSWATVLVGTLGAGGPGYFVLDVTDPSVFAESSFANSVLIDATDTNPATSPVAGQLSVIGNQFSPPVMAMYTASQSAQIIKINSQDPNGEWGVIMGNGYNSASGLPVLLIQSLSHPGRPLYTVPAICTEAASACVAAGNGLGAPRPIDVDGNGTADIVYAGDLLGNLWKFDISNPDHAQWRVAYADGNGQPAPLFTATGPTGAPQPITSAPAVTSDPNGGFMVVFGTGMNLTDADTTDTRLNTVYALYDNQTMTVNLAARLPGADTTVSQVVLGSANATDQTSASASPIPAGCLNGTGAGRYGCLYQQTGGALDAANANGVSVGVSSDLTREQIDDQHYFGWYYDIPDIANGNAAKVLANPVMMSDNTLMFYSQNVASSSAGTSGSTALTPTGATESCSPVALNSAVTTVNFFDLFTGNYPDNTITVNSAEYTAGKGNRFQINGASRFISDGADALSATGANATITSQPTAAPAGRRVGWRIGR
ncbi:MAG: hypothetical protein LBH10_05120, partial [Burkholderiaceae bacterium]|jgi:type IV pilus assembly protein PilY1|nr:hypothetical protein [Burkholderiaceae bacterium]